MNNAENSSQFILYTTPDGEVKVDTIIQNETTWLIQAQMAEIFDVKSLAVTKHLKNTFESNKLDEKVVCSILEHTTQNSLTISKMETVHQDGY